MSFRLFLPLTFLAVLGIAGAVYGSTLWPEMERGIFITASFFWVLIGVVYGYWLLRRIGKLDRQFHLLQRAIASLSPTIESMIVDQEGTVLWTTHPNAYPHISDFMRKLSSRIDSGDKISDIRHAMENNERADILFSSGGNGLGQEKKWWIYHQAPFEKTISIIILREVTSHMAGYQKLKENYTQIQDFLANAPFGLLYTSAQGLVLGGNDTFYRWLHCEPSQVMGQPLQRFLKSSEDHSPLVKLVAQDKSEMLAWQFKSPGDPQTRLNPTVLCRLDESFGDIPDSLFQQTLFLDAAIPALTLDQGGLVTGCNVSLSIIFGKNPTGQLFVNLIHLRQRQETQGRLQKIFDQRLAAPPFEIRFEGDKFQATVYSSRPYPKGKTNEVLLQFIDISEQKRLEDQFIQSQKMQAVGQLAGGIAHDFNNLLTAMIGYSDLLLQRHLPNDPSYTDVMQIKQNASRAANLVRQLLAFSRRQTLQPKVVVITDHLVELSTLLRRLIGAGIDFKMDHARDLWPVKVDVSQLEQVIINLVVNARDSMKHGGRLTLQTRNVHLTSSQHQGPDLIPKGDYISISVMDTGRGIAPENLPYIFEPFFSTKEVGEGTGLGLSTVYGIVKQTGGFVSVDTKVGQGTTLTILLPKYVGAMETEGPKVETPFHDLTGEANILLVEDEDAVRTFGARALREKGYAVVEAESGDVALELVQKGRPFDLLITDVVMPRMDGPTLCQKVREIDPEIRVIFISGYTEDTFRKNLSADAHIHFLPKPFTLKDLAQKVKEVLGS